MFVFAPVACTDLGEVETLVSGMKNMHLCVCGGEECLACTVQGLSRLAACLEIDPQQGNRAGRTASVPVPCLVSLDGSYDLGTSPGIGAVALPGASDHSEVELAAAAIPTVDYDSSQQHRVNSIENSVSSHNWYEVNLWEFEWKTTAKTFLRHRLSTGRFLISTFIQEAPVVSGIQPLPSRPPFKAPVPARKKKARSLKVPKKSRQTFEEQPNPNLSVKKQACIRNFLFGRADQ